MCKYSEFNYKCPHEKLDDNDYCIFHIQDDNKDIDEFNKRINELLETEEDSIHLNGFYFPPYSSDYSAQNFKKTIYFNNVIFSGKADFSHATFSEIASFSGATFSDESNFIIATFSGIASFSGAIFSGEASFRNATFSGKANFIDATFSGNTDFKFATFSEETSFRNVTFSEEASFRNAEISGIASFSGAIFSGETSFYNTKLIGNTDFSNAKFSGKANFNLAKFSGNVNFKFATFSGTASFNGAIFFGEVYFNNVELTGKFVFIPIISGIIIFKHTYFSDNVRIKANMSKFSFANSNIERVDMTDSIWIRDDDKSKNSFSAYKKRFKEKIGLSETSIIIWEEYQGRLSSNWKALEGIYRRLKQSYQRFGDNSTAGKFYYQEMECKRKQLKGIEKHFWNVFYKKLCGYGEKPFNVIWASLFLVFASAFSYLFGGIEFVGSSILKVPPNVIDYNLSLNSFGIQWAMSNIDSVLQDFLLCLYTSVITFTTLGYGDVHPIGFSRIVASVEAGFGIIMTALFIFVFSRKMLR